MSIIARIALLTILSVLVHGIKGLSEETEVLIPQ